jgi:VWFA-related protein
MPRCKSSGCSHTVIVFALLAVFALPCDSLRAQSQSNNPSPAPPADQAPLKVATNLVVVRVVVRDAQGKPVEGLKKEDFKIFDRGKEQTITQFQVESALVQLPNPAPVEAPAQAPLPAAPAAPGTAAAPARFLALYFDDLNTSFTDMAAARDAAERYISTNLQPQDRVAVFTTEATLMDFTSDAKLLHEALLKLRANPRSRTLDHDCPQLSDFQAQQILENPNNQNSDAWRVANNELAACDTGSQPPSMPGSMGSSGGMPSGSPAGSSPGAGGGSSPGGPGGAAPGTSGGSAMGGGGPSSGGFASNLILQRARTVMDQVELQARANLQAIERVVTYTSQMPGQRSVVLVSSGFLSQSVQNQVDRLIDRSLRSQVVISALDPKGLATFMREMDVTQLHSSSGDSLRAGHSLDSTSEMVTTSVLADVAEGTGGEFFHNKNDLQAGFGALGGSPVSYILAFAPDDIKADGKFHALKVTLAGNEKGISIQARRGYFAPTNDKPRALDASEKKPAKAESPIEGHVREMAISKTDVAQLPVTLIAKPSEGDATTHALSVSTHLDTKSLHFQKEGNHNTNTVMFVFAVFDQNDNLLDAQLRRAKVTVPDEQLPALFASGLDLSLTFQLKPGTYRLREVVTESEDHQMTAFSRSVTIQ